MKKRNVALFTIGSLILAFSLMYIAYLVVIEPRLFPWYGGGERSTLNQLNNYTISFPLPAVKRLIHIEVYSTNPVEVFLDEKYVGEGKYVKFDVLGDIEHEVLIKGCNTTEVYIKFTMEINYNKLILSLTALILSTLLIVYALVNEFMRK